MHTSNWVGIIVIIFVFLFLTGLFASKIEVSLPYSTEPVSVLDVIWDNVSDWVNPFY